jgi:hypothetical protein
MCVVDVIKDCKECGSPLCSRRRGRCLRTMNAAAAAAGATAAAENSVFEYGGGSGASSLDRRSEDAQQALRRRMEQTASKPSVDPAAVARFARGRPQRMGAEEEAVVAYAERFLRGSNGGGDDGSLREPTAGDLEGLRRAVLGLEVGRVYRAALEGFLRRLRALADEGLEMGDDGAMGRLWGRRQLGRSARDATTATTNAAANEEEFEVAAADRASGSAVEENVEGRATAESAATVAAVRATVTVASQAATEAGSVAEAGAGAGAARMRRFRTGKELERYEMMQLDREGEPMLQARREASYASEAAAVAAATAAAAAITAEEDRAVREELQAWAAREGGPAGYGGAPLDELAALYALHRGVDAERTRTEALAVEMEAAGECAEVAALVREFGLWWRLASSILLHGIGAAVGATYGGRPLAAPLPPFLSNVGEVLSHLRLRARVTGALDVLERLGLAPVSRAQQDGAAVAKAPTANTQEDAAAAAESEEAANAGMEATTAIAAATGAEAVDVKEGVAAVEEKRGAGAGLGEGTCTAEPMLGGAAAGGTVEESSSNEAASGCSGEAPGGSTAPGATAALAAHVLVLVVGGIRESAAGSVIQPASERNAAELADATAAAATPVVAGNTTAMAGSARQPVMEATAAMTAVAAATTETALRATDTAPHHAAVVRALEACASDGATYLRSAHAAVLALPPAPSEPAEAARCVRVAAQQIDPSVLTSTLAEAASAAAALRGDRRSLCDQHARASAGLPVIWACGRRPAEGSG